MLVVGCWLLDVFLLFSLLAPESVSAAEAWIVRVEEHLHGQHGAAVFWKRERNGNLGTVWIVYIEQSHVRIREDHRERPRALRQRHPRREDHRQADGRHAEDSGPPDRRRARSG